MAKYKKALLFILCIILSFTLMGCGENTAVVVSEHYVYESEEGEAVEASSSSPEVSSEETSSKQLSSEPLVSSKPEESSSQKVSSSEAETSSQKVKTTPCGLPLRTVHPNKVKSITVNGVSFPIRLVGKEMKEDGNSFRYNNVYKYKCDDIDKYFYCDVETGVWLNFSLDSDYFEKGEPLSEKQLQKIADEYFTTLYGFDSKDYDQSMHKRKDGTIFSYYETLPSGFPADAISITITGDGKIFKLDAHIDTQNVTEPVKDIDTEKIFSEFKRYMGDEGEYFELLSVSKCWYLSKSGYFYTNLSVRDSRWEKRPDHCFSGTRKAWSEYIVKIMPDGSCNFDFIKTIEVGCDGS